MIGSVNKVILIGNVGRDPEIRVTQDGKELVNLSLATSDSWKDKHSGERREKTEWHRVVIFNESLVNIVKNYVKKGSKLYIEGSLQTRKWSDQSGHERHSTEIILQNFNSTLTILDSPKSHEHHDHKSRSSFVHDEGNNGKYEELDDEIPF